MSAAPLARVDLPVAAEPLRPFVDAGVFGPAEVHLTSAFARLAGVSGLEELLALAVAARAPRFGHVGVRLEEAHRLVVDLRSPSAAEGAGDVAPDQLDGLPWPDPSAWERVLSGSAVVAGAGDGDIAPLRPLVLEGGRLYLHRHWADERLVADRLAERGRRTVVVDDDAVEAALARAFGAQAADHLDAQVDAARRGLRGRLSVVVGGPGTGKTRTVARLLTAALVLDDAGRPGPTADPRAGLGASSPTGPLRVALAAPTGKAAARMTEAVRRAVDELAVAPGGGTDGDADELATAGAAAGIPAAVLEHLRGVEATTVHRLLGVRSDGTFRHDSADPLPHDVVVVDEASMVALPLMARLVDAVRDDARLVLVGDPDQLVSVEAGSVLADVVAAADDPSGTSPVAAGLVRLGTVHRFGAHSGIAALADAVRRGDEEEALELLSSGGEELDWIDPDARDGASQLAEVLRLAAEAGSATASAAHEDRVADALAAARRMKVLVGTRHGELGLADWTERISSAVAGRSPRRTSVRAGRWHVGRPVIITRNDPVLRVANGDTGVVVERVVGGRPSLAVAVDLGGEHRPVAVARLDHVEDWWAMTIHKSQGSEFDHVVVSLPRRDSPVLTRELLYTAVTRARARVTVVATRDALRWAVGRPATRASGLRDRLSG